MRLEDKVAVVTGAARGFGRAIAERFAAEGASVVVCDLLEEEGRETVAAIEDSGGAAVFARADVTVSDEVAAAIGLAEERFGRLDIAVANAGVFIGVGLEELTEEQYRTQTDVNIKGTWLTIKHTLPAMRRAGGGSIVVTSSAAAFRGLPGAAALYGTTKAALVMLMKNTALAVARERIRCNAVAPGPVATEFYHFTSEQKKDWVEHYSPEVPLGFLGDPIDVANAALFLASDEARWVTGSVLGVDGGFTI